MKNLCIYHKNCADGFGAAVVVKHFFATRGEDCDLFPAGYGDKEPNVEDKNVVIVDFSYSRSKLIEMYTLANELVVLDHHKTAQDDLKDLYFCTFDMTKSGAMLAWEHFFTGTKAPKLIEYIQDRDLWQWKLPSSKNFSAALSTLPKEYDIWVKYLLDDGLCNGLFVSGSSITSYQREVIKQSLVEENVRLVNLAGSTVPIMNCTTLVSEICGQLAESYPFAITYYDTAENRVYSLRSKEHGGVNVATIAKMYGGGGHPNASGFSIPLGKTQI